MDTMKTVFVLFALFTSYTDSIEHAYLIIQLSNIDGCIQLSRTEVHHKKCQMGYSLRTINDESELSHIELHITNSMLRTLATTKEAKDNMSDCKPQILQTDTSLRADAPPTASTAKTSYSYCCLVYNTNKELRVLTRYASSAFTKEQNCTKKLQIRNNRIETKNGSVWLENGTKLTGHARWVFLRINKSNVFPDRPGENCLIYDFGTKKAITSYCKEDLVLDGTVCSPPAKTACQGGVVYFWGLTGIQLALLIGVSSVVLQLLFVFGCVIFFCRNKCSNRNKEEAPTLTLPRKTSQVARAIRLHSMESDFPSADYDHMPPSHQLSQPIQDPSDPHIYAIVGKDGVGNARMLNTKRANQFPVEESSEYAEPYTHLMSLNAQEHARNNTSDDVVAMAQHCPKNPSPTFAPPMIPDIDEYGKQNVPPEDEYAELSQVTSTYEKRDPRYVKSPYGATVAD